MPYEQVVRQVFRSESPTVSVHKNGRVALNPAAHALFEKVGAPAVALFWDRDAKRVAFRAVHKKDRHSYNICPDGRGRSASICAQNLFRSIGWTSVGPVNLDATWNPAAEMLEVDLPAEYLYGGVEKDDSAPKARSASADGNADA